MLEVESITRHQRRARRRQRLAAGREAGRAALQAGLDYRVSGETGALVVHTHSLSWHRANVNTLGWEEAFQTYETHRKPRTSKIQAISSANTWMQTAEGDTNWLYDYDAWNACI